MMMMIKNQQLNKNLLHRKNNKFSKLRLNKDHKLPNLNSGNNKMMLVNLRESQDLSKEPEEKEEAEAVKTEAEEVKEEPKEEEET